MLNEPDEVVKRSRLRDVIAARLHDYRVDRLGARKQEAISLEILEATGVKIGSSSVGEYERPGSARIPADYIAAFCQTYGVEPRYLLLGEGPIDADPSSSGRSIIEGFLREQLAQYRGSIPEDPGEEEAT